jgi:hypothetical protein
MQSGSMARPNSCCPAYPMPISPMIAYAAQPGSNGALTSESVPIVINSEART